MSFGEVLIKKKYDCIVEIVKLYSLTNDAAAEITVTVWENMKPKLLEQIPDANINNAIDSVRASYKSFLEWGLLCLAVQGILFGLSTIPGIDKLSRLHHMIAGTALLGVFLLVHRFRCQSRSYEILNKNVTIEETPKNFTDDCVASLPMDDPAIYKTCITKLLEVREGFLKNRIAEFDKKRASLKNTLTMRLGFHFLATIVAVGLLVATYKGLNSKIFNIAYGSTMGLATLFVLHQLLVGPRKEPMEVESDDESDNSVPSLHGDDDGVSVGDGVEDDE